MGNCVTDWTFRRSKFCCCLPARLGAAMLAFLTAFLAGLVAIVLWFEVKTNYFMSGTEKAAFIVAALVETFLFVASVLGFIGTLTRTFRLLSLYTLFLHLHFLLSLIVTTYFLITTTHTTNTDAKKLCEEGLRNDQTKKQCNGLLNITKGVFWAGALVVLGVEAYCTIVVTRYFNQLRYEKRSAKRARIAHRQSAFDAFHARFSPSSSTFNHDSNRDSDFSTAKGMDGGMVHEEEFDPMRLEDGMKKKGSKGAKGRGIEMADIGYGYGQDRARGYAAVRRSEDDSDLNDEEWDVSEMKGDSYTGHPTKGSMGSGSQEGQGGMEKGGETPMDVRASTATTVMHGNASLDGSRMSTMSGTGVLPPGAAPAYRS